MYQHVQLTLIERLCPAFVAPYRILAFRLSKCKSSLVFARDLCDRSYFAELYTKEEQTVKYALNITRNS